MTDYSVKVIHEKGTKVQVTAKNGQGPSGLSAYHVALDNGFVGTEEEWLISLRVNARPEDNGKILTNDGETSYWISLEDRLNEDEILWDLGELPSV